MKRAVGIAVLAAGLAASRGAAQQPAAYEQLQAFSSLLSEVRLYYVDSVTTQQLVRGAIVGLLASLDPHSHFMPREEAARFAEWESGRYAATGVLLEWVDGAVTVRSTYPGSPAARAGVAAGDRVIAIDEVSIAGLDAEAVQARLIGRRGEEVRLLLERGPRLEPDTLAVRLKRDFLRPLSVSLARTLPDGTAYVRVEEFFAETGRDVREAVGRVLRGNPGRLLLDLRGNGGGMLASAAEAVSLFLPTGQLAFSIGGRRRDVNRDFRTERDGPYRDAVMVVLVDEGTASAAEAFAGSLQDHDRALIAGRRTFGKALVQRIFDLPPTNDAVWLTVGYVFTPSGRLIQRRYAGLRPAQYLEQAGRGGNPLDTLAEYHSDAGRIVRGGGGIRPDTTLPAPEPWPAWWTVAADSGFLTAVADSVAQTLPADRASRERWLGSASDWRGRLVPPLMNRVHLRLHVRAEPSEALASQMALAMGARVAQLRWGEEAEADFWLRNDPDVIAALSLFPRAAALRTQPR